MLTLLLPRFRAAWGGGSSKNLRTSHSKRLGIKVYGERDVQTGNIIVRQRGSEYKAGKGVKMGHDHTLFALRDGIVRYQITYRRKTVHVVDSERANRGSGPRTATSSNRRIRKRQQFPPRAERRQAAAAASSNESNE